MRVHSYFLNVWWPRFLCFPLAVEKNIVTIFPTSNRNVADVTSTLSEQALELFTAFLRANRNVLLFAFWEDPGLYGMWNFLIQRYANGRYLTNANMDDRRRPDSWELKVRHLESRGQTGVVSTPVYFTTKVLSWVEAQAESKSLQVWFADKVGKEIDIYDFFSIHYLYKTLWSNNFPHNSPMWRASIHKRVGYFNTTYDPLSDYEFWVRCRFYNIFFYVLPEPLELYYENPNSYDHRAGEGSFDQRVVMFTRFVYNLYLN